MAFFLAALLLLAPPSPAPAEEETRSVTVTVTDEKGTPIDGLVAQDLAVLENGAVRTLTRVERDERPLRLAVLVDTSEPMRDHYRLQILDPLPRLLGRLPRGTEFAVWTTGDRPNKVVDYGQGTAAAAKALSRTFPTGSTQRATRLDEG